MCLRAGRGACVRLASIEHRSGRRPRQAAIRRRRAALVDIIDVRYWTYTTDGSLYAPPGGTNLAPRQHLRQEQPQPTSFASIVRSVREYRTRYPDKAVTYFAEMSCRVRPAGWAALIGGGSLPAVPSLPEELRRAIAQMPPRDLPALQPRQWCLAEGDAMFLVYSDAREAAMQLDLPDESAGYDVLRVNPVTGVTTAAGQLAPGRSLHIPASTSIFWLRRIERNADGMPALRSSPGGPCQKVSHHPRDFRAAQ